MSRSTENSEYNLYNHSLRLLQQVLLFVFEILDDFVNVAVKKSVEGQIEIDTKIEDWDKKHPNHEFSGYEMFESKLMELVNYDSQILYSVMILSFSKFEASYNFLCREIANEKKYNLYPEDFSGKGISQSKLYLEKVFKIDYSDMQDLWKRIEIFKTLRNKIAHSNNFAIVKNPATLTTQSVYKDLNSLNGCNISSTGHIEITTDTIKQFLRDAENFLMRTFDKLKEPEIV